MPAAEGQIVVCQCHRSCWHVEVEQLVRYFPLVQFLDKVVDCPLLCKFRGWSRQCTVRAVLGQGR